MQREALLGIVSSALSQKVDQLHDGVMLGIRHP
jgi:hypothetical protein